MIYTQYPYFVKRAVYKAIPTRDFCVKVMEHFSLSGYAEEVFRDYLSRKIPMLQHEEFIDECDGQPRPKSSFWTLRQIGKWILPYNLVLILRRFMLRHHI